MKLYEVVYNISGFRMDCTRTIVRDSNGNILFNNTLGYLIGQYDLLNHQIKDINIPYHVEGNILVFEII